MLKQFVHATLRRIRGALEPGAGNAVAAQLQEAADRLGDGDSAAAERLCHRILARDPRQADAVGILGQIALNRRDFGSAIEFFDEAVALRPGSAAFHNGRGMALLESWRGEDALAAFRRALALDPSHRLAHGNLLYLMNMLPEFDDEQRYRAHLRWAEQCVERPRTAGGRHANTKHRDRVLRVGYVSADFRNHAVGHFIGPVLAHHDRGAVSAYCYSNHPTDDDATARMRRHATWRSLHGLADAQAEALVLDDGIDLLVDLSGHTRGNRLPLFARKPAPVQASYLGYPSTTGLREVDYRLTDAYAEPAGVPGANYSEKPVRLPHSLWCWHPGDDFPAVNALPARVTGRVTFGSMNSMMKLNMRTLETWARILKSVRGSRLLLATVAKGEARQRIADAFARRGIESTALEFADRLTVREFRELFARIDIALDTFPCNGGTTTCESLWSGVPVVSLKGTEFRSRAGLSLLTNAGLAHLVADGSDEYVATAVALAGDLAALGRFRSDLRTTLRASPLMDITGYVRALEEAYRFMWCEWCDA